MARRTINLDDRLYAYFSAVAYREPAILRRLREETARLPNAGMQISPELGQFFALLVELLDVKLALEIGVFTGYSSLSVARAMAMDGRVVAIERNAEWAEVARRYWKEAEVEYKIDLRLGEARDVLEQLHTDVPASSFDFVFIDADKVNYDSYFEHALHLVRPGGLIAVDNTLWGGRVADTAVADENTAAIRDFNAKVAGDERVTHVLLPLGDGLTLARKR